MPKFTYPSYTQACVSTALKQRIFAMLGAALLASSCGVDAASGFDETVNAQKDHVTCQLELEDTFGEERMDDINDILLTLGQEGSFAFHARDVEELFDEDIQEQSHARISELVMQYGSDIVVAAMICLWGQEHVEDGALQPVPAEISVLGELPDDATVHMPTPEGTEVYLPPDVWDDFDQDSWVIGNMQDGWLLLSLEDMLGENWRDLAAPMVAIIIAAYRAMVAVIRKVTSVKIPITPQHTPLMVLVIPQPILAKLCVMIDPFGDLCLEWGIETDATNKI